VRVLDLTHAFDNGMPVFPGLPDPSFQHIAQVERMSDAHHLDVCGEDVVVGYLLEIVHRR